MFYSLLTDFMGHFIKGLHLLSPLTNFDETALPCFTHFNSF